jgi:hypothetical protein
MLPYAAALASLWSSSRANHHLTYLAGDELEIASALRVTVSSTELGTGLVGGVACHATILLHGDKVQGAVEAASDAGQVHVEGELVVEKVEGLVLCGAVEQVRTRADVGAVLVLGDEVELQGVAAGADTVGARVVGTLEGALGGAVGVGRASAGPVVSVVAVGARR